MIEIVQEEVAIFMKEITTIIRIYTQAVHRSTTKDIRRHHACSLQLNYKGHIYNMIVISSPGIESMMVMIRLTDIFWNQSQIIQQSDVESSIPARFLEPCKAITGEFTPIRFNGKMYRKRHLWDRIIHLCSC
jgi:hypothetical protein